MRVQLTVHACMHTTHGYTHACMHGIHARSTYIHACMHRWQASRNFRSKCGIFYCRWCTSECECEYSPQPSARGICNQISRVDDEVYEHVRTACMQAGFAKAVINESRRQPRKCECSQSKSGCSGPRSDEDVYPNESTAYGFFGRVRGQFYLMRATRASMTTHVRACTHRGRPTYPPQPSTLQPT